MGAFMLKPDMGWSNDTIRISVKYNAGQMVVKRNGRFAAKRYPTNGDKKNAGRIIKKNDKKNAGRITIMAQ